MLEPNNKVGMERQGGTHPTQPPALTPLLPPGSPTAKIPLLSASGHPLVLHLQGKGVRGESTRGRAGKAHAGAVL